MTVHIKIPATSANIGSGFDSLGMALSLYNEVTLEEYDGVDIKSLDGTDVPTGEDNLIYQTVKRMYRECGRPFPGLRITQVNAIPITRGLGSSSACIVGGLLGANCLLGEPMNTHQLVDLAAAIEGHPDNVAPALLGGFVSAVLEDERVYYVKKELDESLRFAAFVPNFALSTEVARGALPRQVSHKDAVFNLSRAALMATSICTGKLENIRIAAGDRIHQPYRLGLIPGGKEIFQLAYNKGALAAFISGAGPTILTFVDWENKNFVAAMEREIAKDDKTAAFEVKWLRPDNDGAVVTLVND